MSFPISKFKYGWFHLLLNVLTGTVVATGVVVLLISEKVGAIQLATWQIDGIYLATQMNSGATHCGSRITLRLAYA